jgi:2-C-methyl-D-erythritol 4-phosphate cytidylyltransferase/2-C-methyl-D-erythritol 2,4-cyclodiphosphate synthase
VVIVAAGMARRMGLNTPKPYLILGSKPVLQHAIDVFVAHPHVQWVQVVIHPDHQALYAAAIHPHPKLLAPIHGGAERADSVCRGLEALLPYAPQNVLIHDAARPAVSTGLIDRVLATLESADAVMPVIPVADTLRRKTDAGWSDISRADAVQVQTPQGFNFTHILEAHRTISVDSATLTDAPPTDDIAIFSLAYPEQNVQEAKRSADIARDLQALSLALHHSLSRFKV